MVNLAQVQRVNATPLRHPAQQRSKGPHILRLSGQQFRARLKQLQNQSLASLFINLSKLSARKKISQIAKRFGIKTINIDGECSKKLPLLTRSQLKELSSSSSLTDVIVFLASTLEVKLIHLPESKSLYALADPRNMKKFRALAMISPAERAHMQQEQNARILFYLMANPYLGYI